MRRGRMVLMASFAWCGWLPPSHRLLPNLDDGTSTRLFLLPHLVSLLHFVCHFGQFPSSSQAHCSYVEMAHASFRFHWPIDFAQPRWPFPWLIRLPPWNKPSRANPTMARIYWRRLLLKSPFRLSVCVSRQPGALALVNSAERKAVFSLNKKINWTSEDA